MKKWPSVVAIFILSVALVLGVGCGGGEGAEGVREVKFGVGLPQRGIWGAMVGTPIKQGYELANDLIGEFTVAGQRYKWNLIFEDNGWSSQGGVASATKLIFEDKVNIMLQVGGDAPLAAEPICEQSGVILFAMGTPLDTFGQDKPHTFQPSPCAPPQAAALFKYVSEAHPEMKTAAAASDDTVSGHMFAEAAAMAAEYYGIEWLGTEYYSPDVVEFYPVATKIASKNPDICYTDPRAIVPLREMGWEGTTCFSWWASDIGVGMGWENIQGHLVYYPMPFGEGLPEPVIEIAAEYEQRFGVEFSQMSYYSVIELYYLTDALKKAGTVDDVDKIIATLETETLDSPVGPVRFGLKELDGIGHQLLMPCTVGEIRGEEYHIVLEMSTDEAEALTVEIFGK